jgi:FAD/FMN-containing dehydrogenase
VTNELQNPDLFWALRGSGSGNFGIIVSYTMKLFPTQDVTVFTYNYPLNTAEVIEWLTSTERLIMTENLTCQLVLSKDGLKFTGQLFGFPGEVKKLLRDLPTPDSEEIKLVSFSEAMAYWNTPTIVQQVKGKSRFFDKTLSREAIQILISGVREISQGPGTFTVGIQQLSGKSLSRTSIPWVKTCPSWINFMLRSQNSLNDYQLLQMTKLYNSILPFASSWSYQGFSDIDVMDYKKAYYGKYYAKLKQIKQKYDPNNAFTYPLGIN